MNLYERRRAIAKKKDGSIVWNGTKFNWTDRYNLGQTNIENPGYSRSTPYYKAVLDFIPCDVIAGRTVSISGTSVAGIVITCAFYSENNESSYIENSYITSNGTKTVPINAKYCRFAMDKNGSVSNFFLRTV